MIGASTFQSVVLSRRTTAVSSHTITLKNAIYSLPTRRLVQKRYGEKASSLLIASYVMHFTGYLHLFVPDR